MEYATLREKIAAEKLEKIERQEQFLALVQEAHAAGEAAGRASKPVPMVVEGHAHPLDDSSPVVDSWFVADGVCGFAWITLFAKGTEAKRFVNWLTGTQKPARPDLAPPITARKKYSGGHEIWVSGFDQSMQRKEAYAQAFANVIRGKIEGLSAYAGSRMD
jgi:hypothetical protein